MKYGIFMRNFGQDKLDWCIEIDDDIKELGNLSRKWNEGLIKRGRKGKFFVGPIPPSKLRRAEFQKEKYWDWASDYEIG